MACNGSVRASSRSGDGEPEASRDRISELPDSILHLILVLVPLVDAVRTCVLSHRWRGVWTRLPLLSLDDDQLPRVSRFPDLVDGVLRGYAAHATQDAAHAAQYAADEVHVGDLFVSVHRRDSVDDPVSFVATLADLAAHRVSGRFGLYLSPAAVDLHPVDDDDEEEAATLQLPCFPRATELSITFTGVDLVMPTTDTFAMLTKLFICGVRFTDDGEGISRVVSLRCPCIKRLELHRIGGLRSLTVSSWSLVSMFLSIVELEHLIVQGQNLRHMLVDMCFVLSETRADMFLSVPALEELLWEDRCPEVVQHGMLPSSLRMLVVAEPEPSYLLGVGGRSNFARILRLFKSVDTLRLEFPASQDRTDQNNLIENVYLPSYSELEFMVNNHASHRFGPTILNLLRKCGCVKKLTLQIFSREDGYIPCASNCNCRQLSVWTDNAINLDSLECVAMYEFRATQDERSFIYYIMRNAKRLHKVSILFSSGANPTRRFFRKLCKLSASGCAVEYYSH